MRTMNAQISSSMCRDLVHEIAVGMADRPGPLLPILHAVQDQLGYVPAHAVPVIAEALNLSQAEVHGVVSFYHLIRSKPPGQKTLYICRAEACQAMGSRLLEQRAKQRLGIDYHQTSSDGRFSLEPVYCLGNCACGPTVMLDEQVHARVTPERLGALLDGEKT